MARSFHRLALALLAGAALCLPGSAEGKASTGNATAKTAASKKATPKESKGRTDPAPQKPPSSEAPAAKRQSSDAPKKPASAKANATEERAPGTKQASGAKRPSDRASKAPVERNAKTTERSAKSTERSAKSTERNAKPTERGAKSTARNVKSAERNVKSAERNAKSVVRDEKPAERGLKPPAAARPMVRRVTPSRLVIPPRDVAERTLAFRYANLGDEEVLAELERRGIAWTPATPPLPGVRTPIRLTGPLRGVRIHSTLPEPQRKNTPFEILDARLALALDDFCVLLARHDVVEIVHYTMYRPPGELPRDLNKQIRHPAGLAIDLGAVRKADGRWLAIGPHWPSDIGAKTCGEGAREHWSRAGREIVSIACEAADLGIFHFILTPHFDAAHADHLHLEIKPDTRWFLVN